MKKTHRFFSLSISLLLIAMLTAPAGLVQASNGLRVITAGPRSLGIGGAGVANDPTSNTIFINPAGMNDVGNEFDLNFTVAFPQTTMGSSLAPAGNPDAVNVGGDDDGILLPNGSAVFSFMDNKLALGVGAFFSAGFSVDFPVSRLNSAITGNLYDRSGRYANLKIIPSASYRVMDNLTVGLGLDINYAFFQSDSAVLTPGFPETAGTNRTDTALGIGGRVGLLYKPLKMLHVGATYITRQHFQQFSRYADLINQGLDLPQEVALGLAIMPFTGATILTDFRWLDWSSGFIGQDIALGGLQWRDQYVFAGGFQYDFDPHFDFPIQLRMGYNYGRSPITPQNAFQNLTIPLVLEHHLTFGFSFDLNKHMGMDAAYVHEFGHTVTDNGTGNPAGQGAFIGASANAFSIGLRGRWGAKKWGAPVDESATETTN
jgi:long-chain fatty acid transport protein